MSLELMIMGFHRIVKLIRKNLPILLGGFFMRNSL